MSSIAVNPVVRPTRPRLRVVRDHERAAPARLTRRGRLTVTLVFLGAVLLAAVAFGARSAASGDAGSPVPTRMVQVGPGDTLWDIASQIAGPGQVREKVLQIEELNALPGPALRVGQRLAVPVR
ncbi:MAG TPA: LysM peptidoglycan-binding domain-containing protein [Nocardioidaceae bacterium]|nr:LysM peptidoglycan-binding domain-containing protein [Nocardioidaceae bacterium]